jgi:hypothetical protein
MDHVEAEDMSCGVPWTCVGKLLQVLDLHIVNPIKVSFCFSSICIKGSYLLDPSRLVAFERARQDSESRMTRLQPLSQTTTVETSSTLNKNGKRPAPEDLSFTAHKPTFRKYDNGTRRGPQSIPAWATSWVGVPPTP